MAKRQDVARLAGVSSATVSRVFNSKERVKEATQIKVLKAARKLDYHPSYSGQIFRNQATRQILFYCPQLFNPFYVHVFYGIDDCAHEYGYSVVISRTFDRSMLKQKRYEGVILTVSNQDIYYDQIDFLKSISLPAISCNFTDVQKNIYPNVQIDFDLATKQAVEHLFELGHRYVAYASDNSQQDSKWLLLQKHINRLGMTSEYLSVTPPPHMYDNLYDLGRHYAEQFNRLSHLPTALIGANDAVACGIIGNFYAVGIKVPEDVSVIGFDDTYLSQYTIPPLSTIRFPKYEIGQQLMTGLKKQINLEPFENNKLPTRLLARESTKKISFD